MADFCTSLTQLLPWLPMSVCETWVRAEGGPPGNPLNIGPGGDFGANAPQATANFITNNSNYAGVVQAGKQNKGPVAILLAIGASPWDECHYTGGSLAAGCGKVCGYPGCMLIQDFGASPPGTTPASPPAGTGSGSGGGLGSVPIVGGPLQGAGDILGGIGNLFGGIGGSITGIPGAIVGGFQGLTEGIVSFAENALVRGGLILIGLLAAIVGFMIITESGKAELAEKIASSGSSTAAEGEAAA